MKNTKLKLKINVVLILFIIILFVILGFCIFNIYNAIKSNNQSEVEVLDSIEGYNYKLDENDSAYFTSLFKQLKTELSSSSVDEENYATLISKLFVTDFYSLNSVLNKNDVGGKQFVYTSYQEDFVKFAKESVYKNIENNIYGKRTQNLPTVISIEVDKISQDEYESESDIVDDLAYYLELTVGYDKDLDYPQTVELILIHSNEKLEIVSMK